MQKWRHKISPKITTHSGCAAEIIKKWEENAEIAEMKSFETAIPLNFDPCIYRFSYLYANMIVALQKRFVICNFEIEL